MASFLKFVGNYNYNCRQYHYTRVPRVGTIRVSCLNMSHKLMLPRDLVASLVYKRRNRIRYAFKVCSQARVMVFL